MSNKYKLIRILNSCRINDQAPLPPRVDDKKFYSLVTAEQFQEIKDLIDAMEIIEYRGAIYGLDIDREKDTVVMRDENETIHSIFSIKEAEVHFSKER